MVVDEWINNNKNEIYNIIREARAEILSNWKELPYNEYIKLLKYKNELDAIEYLLIKGGEKQCK